VLHLSPSARGVTLYHAVASDFAGDAVAVWTVQQLPPDSGIRPAHFPHRHSRSHHLPGNGRFPRITVDDYGSGLSVWQAPGPDTVPNKLYGRKISRSGGFGPKILVSSDGRFARAASTPQGQLSVIWQQGSASWPIQARFGP